MLEIGCKLSTSSLNINTLPVVNEVEDLRVVADTHITLHFSIVKMVARAFIRAFIRSNFILKLCCFTRR